MNYDIMMGSENTCTPFRYEINYRNYFMCCEGNVEIKMAPPHSIKYLYPCYDYENFEFRSPINPWNVQSKYLADFDKIKCLEFTLTKGKTLYIPSYWWYSIKFTKNSSLSCFRYRTYMNNLAISPYVGMHILQLQNIKRNTTKNAHINDLKIKNNNEDLDDLSVNNNNNNRESSVINNDDYKKNNISDPNIPIPINENGNIGSEIN